MTTIGIYKAKAERLYEKMSGEKTPLNVVISAQETEVAAAVSQTKTVYINPLLVINPWERPLGFNLKEWITHKYGIGKEQLTGLKKSLPFFGRLWSRPGQLEGIREFALAHEVAHIYHNHAIIPWEFTASTATSIAFHLLMIDLVAPVAALIATTVVMIVALHLFTIARKLWYQPDEMEADLTALRATGDLQSAKAFFQHKIAYDKANNKPLSPLQKMVAVLTHPESVFHLEHPADEERIRYLEEAAQRGLYAPC